MRYLRNVEDENGDLVELVYYCSELCYAGETDPSVAALSGGAWPCLDSELDEPENCRVCEAAIGGCSHGKLLSNPGALSHPLDNVALHRRNGGRDAGEGRKLIARAPRPRETSR